MPYKPPSFIIAILLNCPQIRLIIKRSISGISSNFQ